MIFFFIECFGLIVSVDGSKLIINIDIFEDVIIVLNCIYIEDDGDVIELDYVIYWCIFEGSLVGFFKFGGMDFDYLI